MLHTHAFTLSQNEEDLFGINFGNPRTRDGLIEWLGDGNALRVNINLLERKFGKMKHTIRFELRLEGGILVPTIRGVEFSKRDFLIHSPSRNQTRNLFYAAPSSYSSTSNISFC